MANIGEALSSLGITESVLRGEPYNDDEFKEVAGDILVDILENHPSEIGYGND